MSPLQLAERYVNETSHSLFLTGKAGTGKTTFLRHIVETTHKRHVVLAPTGVAAINAGGVTIHSFFQLPFCSYLPDVPELITEYQSNTRNRLRRNKIDIIRTLELLIIDEVSMVRADLLDAVDASLRHYRRSARPFGGVQLLLIGDVHQLSPVVTEEERPYIERVYPSPFFFCSKALGKLDYDTIELTQVFRQQDERFVAILNKVREGCLDEETLAALNARLQPASPSQREREHLSHRSADTSAPILLTTHNYQADRVNQQRLDALPTTPYTFDARTEGNFPVNSAPADVHLVLKEGARVMFLKNDSSGGHRYYNGKMAVVSDISKGDDGLQVTVVDDDGEELVVSRERWENLSYEIGEDKSIRQQVDGVFLQLPLRLAWAVTIHKAQGLTFDRVSVDVADAFTFGQVYVALSRCRTLEGLTLRTPVSARCVPGNETVAQFSRSTAPIEQLDHSFESFRLQYRLQLLTELFSVESLLRAFQRLDNLYQSRLGRLYPRHAGQCRAICETLQNLDEVTQRFRQQLRRLIGEADNLVVEERVQKGCRYYLDAMSQVVAAWPKLKALDIDNKEVGKAYDELTSRITQQLRVYVRCLEYVSKQGFSVEGYLRTKSAAMLSDMPVEPRRRSGGERASSIRTEDGPSDAEPAAEVVQLLKAWRKEESQQAGVAAFHVLTQRTLLAVAAALPRSYEQLRSVTGIGPKTIERYGKAILDVIANYRESQGLR